MARSKSLPYIEDCIWSGKLYARALAAVTGTILLLGETTKLGKINIQQ